MSAAYILILAVILSMFPLVLPWGRAFKWGALFGWFGLWGVAFYFLQTNAENYGSKWAGIEILVFISIITFSISVSVRYLIHKLLTARSNEVRR